MSWQAVTWVLEQSLAELGARLVLLAIASHANREGRNAFPSLDTITQETLMSRREVIYCIQKLEESGELRVHRGIGRGNPSRYELPAVEKWLESLGLRTEKVQRLHHLEKGKGATDRVKGAIHDNKRCNRVGLKSAKSSTSAQQPLYNRPKHEPSKAKIADLFANVACLEPSKTMSAEQLRKRKDELLRPMREKGYIT